MCGIAGRIGLKQQPVDGQILARMCDAMRHRGPDDCGYYVREQVGLGHRRLSIIDLSTGHQPLANEDQSVWIVFNGEIYNFQGLRAELEGRGHRFATNSDTETIVHLYEEQGVDCVRRLRGMFAFAIWDQRRQHLFLARDRVGKKPLFYAQTADLFLFASELQGLLQHPALDRAIDPQALDDYLTYGYVPPPKTAFRHVFKLPPAHVLTLRLDDQRPRSGTPRIERYWRLSYSPKHRLSDEEAVAGLVDMLSEATRLRMVADVPLGALLSGGLDSSLVVAIMSRLGTQPVRTFSIGFSERAYDELPYARLVAQRYGTVHTELIVRPQAIDVLPTLVRHYGEPYADSSAVPSYFVAQLTRQHVTVALNGDGGDECLGGYDRYLGQVMADRYARLPGAARRFLVEPLLSLVPASLPRRNRLLQARRFVEASALPSAERYLRWMSYFPPALKARCYTPEFRNQLAGHAAGDWLRGLMAANGHGVQEMIDRLLATDVESYLPYDLLVKMDIATMANSLETRSPFLDQEVMEYCARLPARLKVRRVTLKYLLKKAAEPLLPVQNIRRRKMGFGVPIAAWLRHELRGLMEDTVLAPGAATAAYFSPTAVRWLMDQHLHAAADYSHPLWAILWLELWHRELAGVSCW